MGKNCYFAQQSIIYIMINDRKYPRKILKAFFRKEKTLNCYAMLPVLKKLLKNKLYSYMFQYNCSLFKNATYLLSEDKFWKFAASDQNFWAVKILFCP